MLLLSLSLSFFNSLCLLLDSNYHAIFYLRQFNLPGCSLEIHLARRPLIPIQVGRPLSYLQALVQDTLQTAAPTASCPTLCSSSGLCPTTFLEMGCITSKVFFFSSLTSLALTVFCVPCVPKGYCGPSLVCWIVNWMRETINPCISLVIYSFQKHYLKTIVFPRYPQTLL